MQDRIAKLDELIASVAETHTIVLSLQEWTQSNSKKLDAIEKTLADSNARLDGLEHRVIGNGQPGFIAQTEGRLSKLEQSKMFLAGYAAAAAALLTVLAQVGRLVAGHLHWH